VLAWCGVSEPNRTRHCSSYGVPAEATASFPEVQEILAAIDAARLGLESDSGDPLARARARGVLAQARELWGALNLTQRETLNGPAIKLRALLDNEPDLSKPPPSPEDLLARFGLRAFRPGQREAVLAALEGRDSLVVMPTGGGKSLCYQLPALADRGLVVVVSPLIALMADQLRRLQETGVQAVMLASGMQDGHNTRALWDISSGRAQLVLAAPERFASVAFRQALSERRVGLFVVDEAHCVAEWGHDFRPDYLRLQGAIAALGRPPVMAATATATPRVAEEIAARLGLRDWVSIRSGFDRPNLVFDVISMEGKGTLAYKRRALLGILSQAQARPAIVYCGTRKDTEQVASLIAKQGIATVSYHAGMSAESRRVAQEAFMQGAAEVVVATNAFGMGVDKADVRTVAHWAIPKSLEAYYQEAGRGGRDGKPAHALLLAARVDLGRLIRFITDRKTSVGEVQRYLGRLTRAANGGVLECEPPGEEDRILLSIAERCGAVKIMPTEASRMRLTLTGRLDAVAASGAIKVAQDRNWESYHAIERFIASKECRRRQILDFFGDAQPGAPTGRCCDVCDSNGTVGNREGQRSSGWAPNAPGGMDLRSTPVPNGFRPAAPSAVAAMLSGSKVNEGDLRKLKAWRMKRAEGKPAFVVATDAALGEVLQKRPENTQALLQINGLGLAFCEKHGESLLQALRELATG
jgi:ATP-dependent DNA helicase RecQ